LEKLERSVQACDTGKLLRSLESCPNLVRSVFFKI